MELSDFTTTTTEILGNLNDAGMVSNKLADLTEAFSTTLSACLTAEQQVEKLTAENDKLRQDNMKLFLRATQPLQSVQSPDGPKSEDEETGDSIDRLFKGGKITWEV